MSLGSNIKYKRKALKLSQEYVAEQVGVSRQAVSKWETNQSEPSTKNLMKLADLLDSDMKELVSPEQSKAEQKDMERRVKRSQKNIKMQKAAAFGRVLILIGFVGFHFDPAAYQLPSWYVHIWWGSLFLIGLVLTFVASNDYFKRQYGSKKIIWFDLLFAFSFFFYELFPFAKNINTLLILLFDIAILSIINIKFFIPVWRTPKRSDK